MLRIVKVAFAASLTSVLASASIAGGHSGDGKGFSSVVDSVTTEGTTGVIVHNTASDFWYYENAPEGWPTAAMATCHQSILFKAGQQAPAAIQIICDSVDPDGDASLWTGVVDPTTGVGSGKMVAGTGKYADAEANPTFQTIYDMGSGKSIYQFKW